MSVNSLNSILVEGCCVGSVAFVTTPKGSAVATFKIRSSRYYHDADRDMQEETSFFEVEAWGKLAESISTRIADRSVVRVVGRLKQDRWAGADGKEFSKVKIVAEHIETKPTPGAKVPE